MRDLEFVWGTMAPGRRSWLVRLASGWVFSSDIDPAAAASHHGEHAVLMFRQGFLPS